MAKLKLATMPDGQKLPVSKKTYYKAVRKNLAAPMMSTYRYKVGKWQTVTVPHSNLIMCRNGYHVCRTPEQAEMWSQGGKVYVVEVAGKVCAGSGQAAMWSQGGWGDNKVACSNIRLVRPLKRVRVDKYKHLKSNTAKYKHLMRRINRLLPDTPAKPYVLKYLRMKKLPASRRAVWKNPGLGMVMCKVDLYDVPRTSFRGVQSVLLQLRKDLGLSHRQVTSIFAEYRASYSWKL